MFSSRLRLLASAGILCGALTASTLGTAFAAPGPLSGGTSAVATSTVTTVGQAAPTARTTDNPLSFRHLLKGMGDQLANLFGITTQALRQQLAQGQTLAQIATAHGKTSADVESTVLSLLKSHLDQAVAAGKLSSQREATILAKAPDAISNLTNKNLAPLLQRVAMPHRQRAGHPSAPATATSGVGN